MFLNRKKNLSKIIEKEQLGILNRYLQEHNNWQLHLNSTKDFIINSLLDSSYQSIAILGSGFLLDVPIDFLIKKFNKIFLVDIVHPKQIIQKYSKIQSISFIHMDVSGQFYFFLGKHSNQSSNHWPFVADIVVSVNLLSQLAELPLDYFQADIELNKLTTIQEEHVSKLQEFKKYILISDIFENRYFNTESIQKKLINCELPLWDKRKEWIWTFDSSGHYEKNIRLVEKVVWAFAN